MTNLQEIWLPVVGFENAYQVSNLGRIKSIERYIKRRWKTPSLYKGGIVGENNIDRYGYLKVSLSIGGKIKFTTVHRLVAQAFIPNYENKKTVNHIDGNKLNNNASNLEWCTNRENIIHSYRALGRKGNITTAKTVNQFDLNGIIINTFSSVIEASKFTGVGKEAIYQCTLGYNNTAGGYKWKYDA